MKIILVAQNSSYTHTNPAVRALCCALRARGYEADFVETTVNDRGGMFALLERLAREDADLYGFSVYIWNRERQLCAAEGLKLLRPDCITVFGGPEVSFEGADFFEQYPFADHLIRGEGEDSFAELVGKILRKDAPPLMDARPFAGFSQSPEPYLCHEYSSDTRDSLEGKLVYYESSRGCPFSCSYCLSSAHSGGKGVRAKSVEMTLHELGRLSLCGARTVKLLDRTFNFDIPRAKQIFTGLIAQSERNLSGGAYHGVAYHFEICAELLDKETIEILSRAPEGLFRFEIGVQSTNPAVLRRIGRSDNIGKTLFAIKELKERTAIPLHLDLIAGLPGEDFSGIKQSFDEIYALADRVQLGFLKLLRGTKMREQSERDGILFLPHPPYHVLRTKQLSFFDLLELRNTEKAYSLLCAGAGGFSLALDYILSHAVSPFDFFHQFSKVSPDGRSKKAVYPVLFDFSVEYLGIGGDRAQRELLCDYLIFDFLLHNQGPLPDELRPASRPSEEQRARLRGIVAENKETPPFRYFFPPACEYHLFSFDPAHFYIIDRKNRRYEAVDVETAGGSKQDAIV